ncbi:MAG: hypothetical protein IIW42_01545 [Bacteroidaceae bacterium]|nr:hypothetical protein [Bacteroidaceae bacterium]
MFQGLRQNSIIYILEKNGVPSLKVGQVVSVSNPQPKFGTFNPNMLQETFVDVTAKVDNETIELKQLPASSNFANLNGAFVSDNRDVMSSEVEAILKNSEQVIESVPYHEDVKVACKDMFRVLNPQVVKEQERDEKMGMLEKRIGGMEGTLDDIMSMLKTLNKQSKSV